MPFNSTWSSFKCCGVFGERPWVRGSLGVSPGFRPQKGALKGTAGSCGTKEFQFLVATVAPMLMLGSNAAALPSRLVNPNGRISQAQLTEHKEDRTVCSTAVWHGGGATEHSGGHRAAETAATLGQLIRAAR